MTGYVAKPFKAHDLFAAIEVHPWRGRVRRVRRTMQEAGAEEAVAGILATFANTLPQRLEALADATGGQDPEPIQRAAHAFKSAAATIGARRLAQLLEEMEASARGGDVVRAQSALQEVRSEALIVLDHVRMAVDGGGHG